MPAERRDTESAIRLWQRKALEVGHSPPLSTFEFTPALSDDPFITFPLLASREGSLEVHLVNNRGQRFETAHEITFS